MRRNSKAEEPFLGAWSTFCFAVCLLTLALALHRCHVPLPSTLLLTFVGLALSRYGREFGSMSFLDWVVLGPYLLAIGTGFGRDLTRAHSMPLLSLHLGTAFLAILAPQCRRDGPEQVCSMTMILLYCGTLLARSFVPAQEIALFIGALLLRFALLRVRRLQEGGAHRNLRTAWLVLGPAVRRAILAMAILLAAEGVVDQAIAVRDRAQPHVQRLIQQAKKIPEAFENLVAHAELWYESLAEKWRNERDERNAGVVESLISGQLPIEPGPVPGLEVSTPFQIAEPDELRFERDVRQRIELPGVEENLILARVRSPSRLPNAPYLRRATFDHYEDGAWSFPAPVWLPRSRHSIPRPRGWIELAVHSVPGPRGELFIPSPFLGLETALTLQCDRAGNIRTSPTEPKSVSIKTVSLQRRINLSAAKWMTTDPRFLQVPPEIAASPDFQNAVRESLLFASSASDLPEAAARFARTNFLYTRTPGHQPGKDPLLEFLRTKIGFCQHYATLTALVLRSQGIPCRIAGGLAFGVPKGSEYSYGLDNGHAWVELPVSGIGWVPLDPTAGARDYEPGPPDRIERIAQRVESDSGSSASSGSSARTQQPPFEPLPNSDPAPEPSLDPASPPAFPSEQEFSEPLEAETIEPTPRSQAPLNSPPDSSHPSEANTGAIEPESAPPDSLPDEPGDLPPDEPRSNAPSQVAGIPEPDPSPSEPSAVIQDEPPLDSQHPVGKSWQDLFLIVVSNLDWILLLFGVSASLIGIFLLRRRADVQDALGMRPQMRPEQAEALLSDTRSKLSQVRNPGEAVELLFELFTRQLNVWGYGRKPFETERDFALAVGDALGASGRHHMERAVDLVEFVRYGALEPSSDQVSELERRFLRVTRSIAKSLGFRSPVRILKKPLR